jgi:hypothetical protein
VIAGLWRQHELWDGTYTFLNLVEIHDVLDAKELVEAQARARMALVNA